MAKTGRAAAKNPLRLLRDVGQSVWLDFIHRGILRSGELKRLVEEDAVTGVTSNPTIFDKAIAGSTDYDAHIADLAAQGKSAGEIYEALVVEDIRGAADVLRPVFDETHGADGYVSVEVSPRLAHDTEGTVREVRRWAGLVARPNVMVKIPGTAEGIPAIEEMIAEGCNVNVTLIFSVAMYRRVMEAYLRGLERRLAAGGALHQTASVASFFVSRIDTETDKRLETRLRGAGAADAERLRGLLGKIAIANAKVAYQAFRDTFTNARFQALASRGARVQRPLWASTSTKNPAYPDLLYVEALVGPDTVDTMPPQTLEAFRGHGRIVPGAVMEDLPGAGRALAGLAAAGLSLDEITRTVLDAGVKSFDESFTRLLAGIETKRRSAAQAGTARPASA